MYTTLKCISILCNDCPDWDTSPGPDDYRSDALATELHRHLGKLPKSLRLIAKHWAREYREKTTPSRIFMPCNLSSCRVLENPRVPFTLEFQQGKDKMFRFILEFKPLNIFFKGQIWYKSWITPEFFFHGWKMKIHGFFFFRYRFRPGIITPEFFQGADHPWISFNFHG